MGLLDAHGRHGRRLGEADLVAKRPSKNVGPTDGAKDTQITQAGTEGDLLPRPPTPAEDPARWMYMRIIRSIEEFEKRLTSDEEIGARLVATPGEEVFHVDNVAYWTPDMIMFEGASKSGRRVQLLQHYSQLSLMLTSLPKEKAREPARRIGFDLARRFEEEWGDPQT
jgi:hypothetical protein